MRTISEESINKISQTKLENGRKRIISGFVKNDIPEQSENNLNVHAHRTRERLTFEEFKNLIAQGHPLKYLCEKYSKHLMAFYSALSQGKINLSKEKFEEQYNKGIPLDEIARANNIPREHITYLRDYYGIKIKGANYQKRLKNEVPLSQEAKDIIIGSLLGDGHITPCGYFSEKHSEKQVEYLEWKANFLKPILNPKSFSVYKYFDKRHGSTNYSFCLRTISHSFLYEMRSKFYKTINGKYIKIVPDDIGDMMNETVLSVWFMDDGSTDWMYRNGIKQYQKSQPKCKISSQSFTLEENQTLVNSIMQKFNIEACIRFREKDKKHPYITFDGVYSSHLTKLLLPLSVNCCMYKFSEEKYLNKTAIDPEQEMEKFIKKHNIS
jgi:hypothetical protein